MLNWRNKFELKNNVIMLYFAENLIRVYSLLFAKTFFIYFMFILKTVLLKTKYYNNSIDRVYFKILYSNIDCCSQNKFLIYCILKLFC